MNNRQMVCDQLPIHS